MAKRKTTRRVTPAARPGELWEAFAARHAAHPGLNDEVLYALPERLLSTLVRVVPELLEVADIEFERDLRASAGSGFFRRQPFVYGVLDEELLPRGVSQDLAPKISELLAAEMHQQGRSPAEIERYFQESGQFQTELAIRQRGYVGWLVTDRTYRQEVSALRADWQDEGSLQLPRLPRSYLGESPAVAPDGFVAKSLRFCCRWGLDCLATWDLPVPMQVEWIEPALYHLRHVAAGGLTMFVPWYLLRDKSFNLYELARHRQRLESPDHLASWLERQPKYWGYSRLATMLVLYVYLELALRRRYGARLHGKQTKIDGAFAEYVASSEGNVDTIRKTRQTLQQRLQGENTQAFSISPARRASRSRPRAVRRKK